MPKARDVGKGIDNATVSALVHVMETIQEKSLWTVDKFYDPKGTIYSLSRRGLAVPLIVRRFPALYIGRMTFRGNLLLNEGINELWTLVAGTGGTKFDNANAYLGVGDSNTAAEASQTGLQAPTNKFYKGMNGGYPTYGSSQKTTWQTTYGTGEANFAWNEFTVANGGDDSAKNLNRKVQAIGTKTSAMSWILTLDTTLA